MKRFLFVLLGQVFFLGDINSGTSSERDPGVASSECFVITTRDNDRHVKELVGHVYRMTGVVMETGSVSQRKKHAQVFLLGNADLNPLVKELEQNKILHVDWKGLGGEGFVLRSFSDKGIDYLLIAGTTPRTTSYGVAEYLERFCGVGFFADGNFIPDRKSIPCHGIDVEERPRFSVRFWNSDTGHWGLKKF